MARRLALAGVLLVLGARAEAPDEFVVRLAAFDQHYEDFKRDYCSLRGDEVGKVPCHVRSSWNAGAYARARAAAKRLFQLRD